MGRPRSQTPSGLSLIHILQAAFFDLYSAELEMDKARAELFCLLRDLPERIVQEIGEQVPTQLSLIHI